MIPIFISFLAGISTVLGGIVILFKKNINSLFLSFTMGFSSGVMIGISIFDLIKESFKYLYNINNYVLLIFTCIMIGIFVAFIIDILVPTSNKTSRVGIISLIGLIIHNVPEGIATYITSSYDLKVGISFAIAIALHNIPEGIAIAVPIYYENRNAKKILFLTSLAGLSEVVGALLSYLFLSNYITLLTMGLLFSLIAGIMLYIAVFELIPLSYKNNALMCFYSLLGGLLFILFNLNA